MSTTQEPQTLALHHTDSVPTLAQVLQEMLTEDTGKHMLDSGGAYGRNYDRQRERGFENREVIKVPVWIRGDVVETKQIHGRNLAPFDSETMELEFEIDAYAWLTNNDDDYAPDYTEESHEMTKSLHAFGYSEEWRREEWGATMKAWLEHENERRQSEDMCELKFDHSFNTYNYEYVTNTIWLGHVILDEESGDYYVVLRSHNGCDVRGGYSTPYIFYITDRYVSLEPSRYSGWDSNEHGHYYTDDSLVTRWDWEYVDTDGLAKMLESMAKNDPQGLLFEPEFFAENVTDPFESGLWLVDVDTKEIVSAITGDPIEFSCF